MDSLEKEIEQYLFRRCDDLGWWCIKFIPDYLRGFPDRIVLIHFGRCALVELKRPKGGVLSPAQVVIHERLRRLGFPVHVLKSREDVDQFIDEQKNTTTGDRW